MQAIRLWPPYAQSPPSTHYYLILRSTHHYLILSPGMKPSGACRHHQHMGNLPLHPEVVQVLQAHRLAWLDRILRRIRRPPPAHITRYLRQKPAYAYVRGQALVRRFTKLLILLMNLLVRRREVTASSFLMHVATKVLGASSSMT